MADEVVDQVPASVVPEGHSVEDAAGAIAGLLNSGALKTEADDENDPKLVSVPESAPEAQAESESSAQTGDATKVAATPTAPTPSQARPEAPPDVQERLRLADQKVQEADAARNQLLNTLNTLVPQLQARVQGEFQDIKSIADLRNLAHTDPMRYNDYVLAQAEIQQAEQARQAVLQQQQAAQLKQFESFQQAELAKLPELIPDLANPEKAPALAQKIQDYAKKQGYSPQQLAMASANDFKILHRAMLADEYEARDKAQQEEMAKLKQTAQQKAANAPKVQTPGARTPEDKGQKIQEDFRRLQKSGGIDDAARVFQHMLQ